MSPKLSFAFEGSIRRSWFFGRRELTLRAGAVLPGVEEGSASRFGTEIFRLLYAAFTSRIRPYIEPTAEKPIDLLAIAANLSKKPGGLDALRLKNIRGNRDDHTSRERMIEVGGTVEVEVPDDELELDLETPKVITEGYSFSLLTEFQSFSGKGGIEYRLRYQERLPGGSLASEGGVILPFSDRHFQKVTSFCLAADFFAASAFGSSLGLVPAVRSGFVWELKNGEISMSLTRELERTDSSAVLKSLPEMLDFETVLVRIGLSETFIRDAVEYLEAV